MNVPDLIPTGRRQPQAAREETVPSPEKTKGSGTEKARAGNDEFGKVLETGSDALSQPAGIPAQTLTAPLPASRTEPALPTAATPEVAVEADALPAESELGNTEATFTPSTADPDPEPVEVANNYPTGVVVDPAEIATQPGPLEAIVPAVQPEVAAAGAKSEGGEATRSRQSDPDPTARDVGALTALAKSTAQASIVKNPDAPEEEPEAGPDRIEGADRPRSPAAIGGGTASDGRPPMPAAPVTVTTPDAPRFVADVRGGGWHLFADGAPVHGARSEAIQQAQISPHHLAGQITLAVAAASEGSVEIRLDPPELGRVQIRLESFENGVRAVVMAERPETQDLLRRNSETLARDLLEAGYSSVSLDFSAGGQSTSQRDDRLMQIATSVPVPFVVRGDLRAEGQIRNATGRLDIRL